jgi:hypothetical protein
MNNTRVFRLDFATEHTIDAAIIAACDRQLLEGFKLASTFVWGTDLILIFQKS